MHELWVFTSEERWRQYLFDSIEELKVRVLECIDAGLDFNVHIL